MSKVAEPDLDRLTVETDPSSEPVDWDRTIARFLLALVRRQQSRSAGPERVGDPQSPPDEKKALP